MNEPTKIPGLLLVSELRRMNSSDLREINQPCLVVCDGQGLAVLFPYDQYIDFQTRYIKALKEATALVREVEVQLETNKVV